MGRKGLWILIAAVLVLALGYFWASQQRSTPAPTERLALLSALQGQLNQVQAIEVERPEQPVVRVERGGDGWQVPAKLNYPADAQALGQTLRALSEARVVEARTSNPAYHARLGLAESGAAEEQGVRVRLEFADQTPRIELRVGNVGSRSGQLVRLAGEDQVWLVDRDIPLPASELAWLDRRVTQIPFAQIRQVDVRHADGEQLTVLREQAGEPNLRVRQLPDDGKLAYEAIANGMATLFADLRFNDALPLDQLQFREPPVLRFELQTFDNGSLNGEVHVRAEQYWLVLGDNTGLTAEQLPAASGWAFAIEARDYQALARRLKDLLGRD
jgi:hypothetical protein